jgi:hypothetical protein
VTATKLAVGQGGKQVQAGAAAHAAATAAAAAGTASLGQLAAPQVLRPMVCCFGFELKEISRFKPGLAQLGAAISLSFNSK